MRQIKFRAKSIYTKEWVYGNLRIFGERAYISAVDSHAHSEVFLSTVGQFTGLTDRNGKEIYEGDILHTIGVNEATKGKHYYRSVSFERGSFCMNVKEYHITSPLHNHATGGSLNWEVVGNISDNPELMKKL